MKTLLIFLFITSTAFAQIEARKADVDTTGLNLAKSSLCAKGHAEGIPYREVTDWKRDTLVTKSVIIERTLDANYTVYKCPRCGVFYRYPQAGYVQETRLIIGSAKEVVR